MKKKIGVSAILFTMLILLIACMDNTKRNEEEHLQDDINKKEEIKTLLYLPNTYVFKLKFNTIIKIDKKNTTEVQIVILLFKQKLSLYAFVRKSKINRFINNVKYIEIGLYKLQNKKTNSNNLFFICYILK